MKLSEIDDLLPNGFHDAEVLQFGWDFIAGEAFLEVSFWVGALEHGREKEKVEKRRKGRINLQSISFISFEQPQPRQTDPKPYHPSPGGLKVDGLLADETTLKDFARHKAEISPTDEIFSFYVSNWNSFIHIAAAEAELVWSKS